MGLKSLATQENTRAQLDEIKTAISEVMDPELDVSLLEMDFITRIETNGRKVEIDFQLPTFWCGANFAYLMAADLKEAVRRISWVDIVTVSLLDHFAARGINHAVSQDLGFSAVAPDAQGTVENVRQTFLRRAMLSRQAELISALEGVLADSEIASLSLTDIDQLSRSSNARISNLARRHLVGLRQLGLTKADRGICDANGAAVRPEDLVGMVIEGRRIQRVAVINSELCKLTLEARRETAPTPTAQTVHAAF